MTRQYTIYCGARINKHEVVSDLAFSRFLESEVTPFFPGFTIRGGQGYWEGKAEPSREIVLVASDSARSTVYSIGSAYVDRFRQESVLITTTELLRAEFVAHEVKA